MKTRLMASAILFLAFFQSLGQAPKEVFVLKNDVTVNNIIKRFNPETESCLLELYSVGGYAQLIVFKKLDNNTIIVVLSKNNSGGNMAEINKFYCISTIALETYFKKKGKPEIGILSVPFKLRVDPIKIMAGNTVGPFIGKKFYHQNGTSSTLLTFASLTNVPLNDLNASVPETKWGLGIGGGYVWTLGENFQTGIISGIDLFEGVETWPYKFQPWLSLSIGFTFTTNRNEERAINAAD
jgi:hypothetical protein